VTLSHSAPCISALQFIRDNACEYRRAGVVVPVRSSSPNLRGGRSVQTIADRVDQVSHARESHRGSSTARSHAIGRQAGIHRLKIARNPAPRKRGHPPV